MQTIVNELSNLSILFLHVWDHVSRLPAHGRENENKQVDHRAGATSQTLYFVYILYVPIRFSPQHQHGFKTLQHH